MRKQFIFVVVLTPWAVCKNMAWGIISGGAPPKAPNTLFGRESTPPRTIGVAGKDPLPPQPPSRRATRWGDVVHAADVFR